MPRLPGTLTVTMGFNPKNKRVSQMEEQAKEKGQSLSAYIKQMILDLTGAGSFISLRFKEASNVLHTLEQEAQSLEMPLEDYLKALLADRHRALYGGNQQASLWYPKVQPIEREAPAPQGEDEINIDEAMKNIENLVGFYNDMQGF